VAISIAVWTILLVVLMPARGLAGDGNSMEARRLQMVENQIVRRGIKSAAVLDAMRTVERHRFVPQAMVNRAYDDGPLRIGHGQTISQPYIVALMTETIKPLPGDRVLEIGTGSGYQSAVLSRLVEHVFSIEILAPLGEDARERLARLGYENVTVRIGDGYKGWPEEAPFDAIVVTAAPPTIPDALVEQLAEGGRMVVPVGVEDQELLLLTKKDGKVTRSVISLVRFVPMVHGDE